MLPLPDLLPLPLAPHEATAPLLIAGPCSAESREVVVSAARQLKKIGAHALRAGVWKPRTRPGTYCGPGAEGLQWLMEAHEASGLPVYTEVASAEHVALVAAEGLDGVWLGARTVVNPFAVQEIAEALAKHCPDVGVLVKNPVNPDLELWLGALERLHAAGLRRLAAVHRGFSVYGDATFRNPPQWQIPIELHRRVPHLPLLHDPSHCGGTAQLAVELMRRAAMMPFAGFMVESHPHPEAAKSDAAQQLTPDSLKSAMQQLEWHGSNPDAASPSDEILALREQIDRTDSELLRILARRRELALKVGEVKCRNAMPIVQQDRYAALLTEKIEQGTALGLDEGFLRRLFATIHAQSVAEQLTQKFPKRK